MRNSEKTLGKVLWTLTGWTSAWFGAAYMMEALL